MTIVFLLTAIIFLGKLAYEYLYYLMFAYVIEQEQFTITQGVLLRERSALPLVKINNISLKRTPLEFLFGLHTVEVLTASPITTDCTVIGLSKKNAIDLQTYILALVETALPKVTESTADAMVHQEPSPVPPQAPSLATDKVL